MHCIVYYRLQFDIIIYFVPIYLPITSLPQSWKCWGVCWSIPPFPVGLNRQGWQVNSWCNLSRTTRQLRTVMHWSILAYLLLDTLCGGLWVWVTVESSIGMGNIVGLFVSDHLGGKDERRTPAPVAPPSSEYNSFFPGALAYPLCWIEYP